MGSIIAVIGNSGVGKTTFCKALCETGDITGALEQHSERPFQQAFAQDLNRYALANQIDYLLLRAEQELSLRRDARMGVVDGGLDQDFYIFTRLFLQKGYLNQSEYTLCERAYTFFRGVIPAPDLTIWLQAPVEVIASRFQQRQRPLQIAQIEDLTLIEKLLEEWMSLNPPDPLIKFDVSNEDMTYRTSIAEILNIKSAFDFT